MTPTPQENHQVYGEEPSPNLAEGSIVISGISGVFPEAPNVKSFGKLLYNKIYPVTSTHGRWNWQHPETTPYLGKVNGAEYFDSQFFMVHHRLAECMDPMARKVLEHSYQAIYDAGVNPGTLEEKKVGVYMASTISETEKTKLGELTTKTGFGITGCSKTMYANRISYWLNTKGPSVTLDAACCGSTEALQEACTALNSGICEAALVGGSSLCLLPESQVHFNRCVQLAPDGKVKSFDEHADGCAKSDSIIVLFLQKAKDALRVYGQLINVKNEFISKLSGETGQVFGFVRNPDVTAEFLKRFYTETKVSPHAVEYVEAFGSGDPDADKSELQAIEKVFCENRANPLMVGSVISNIGFTDAASGAAAIIKVLLGYHYGNLAGNLHCSTPRRDIAAIQDGRMRIVTDNIKFHRGYAAVNCVSVTGINAHVLLKGHHKYKSNLRYKSSIPRLVVFSTRQEHFIDIILDELKSRPIDAEEIALFHNIHEKNIPGHLGRGYIILDTDDEGQTISLVEMKKHSSETQRPLWYVYSGMGSQWAGMGTQLMRIPIFAAAIERCRKALEPKGIDIVNIITTTDETIFENVLNSFVGIAAVQIGLTDILKELGLHPDKVIGHSVGELGCAYADGCLTAEEMILAAYSRGVASNNTPLIHGAMAAIGMGFTELSNMCPPEIEIACHNSSTSSTISGPVEKVREFVKELTSKKIFAREVASSNIAYHSRYISDAGPELLRLLNTVITEPKLRSGRWLSTSVPQSRWNEPMVKYCSPEYFTNNLLSSVYFEETSRLIPNNAVLIEIAPHGLLQAILKRSLPQSCLNIQLTLRGHKDNALHLLDAIGKLYLEDYYPRISALYPKVEFPVSTGTPHLSHLVRWNHTEVWEIPSHVSTESKIASSCKFLITLHDDELMYLRGNVIRGQILYPFAGALVAVWDTLAMSLGHTKKGISVKLTNIFLFTQPLLHDQKRLELSVSLNRGNGYFEVTDGESKVATGYITVLENSSICAESDTSNEVFKLTSEELYDHMQSRGYSYSDEFQSIKSANEDLTKAKLSWNNNWVTIIDGMLQLNTLKYTTGEISQPSQIRELIIDTETHEAYTNVNNQLVAEVNDILGYTRCGGLEMHNIQFHNLLDDNDVKMKFKLFAPPHNVATGKAALGNVTQESLAEKPVALQISTVGDLDTLHWEAAPEILGDGTKVLVQYAGVNVSDAYRATGDEEDSEKYFGMDFSGLTEGGQRVMGLVRRGAISSIVTCQPELLWPVPDHWSMEDAATVPLAYAQAYYCLFIKTKLEPNSRILVHGGAGALGQAVIAIALSHNCQVFTTVADKSKKRFLLKLFPKLNADYIGNSRDNSFVDMVLNATNGEGCDVIVSCVREDLKNFSLQCSGFSGVTMDTTQLRKHDRYNYGMYFMTKSRSFIIIDFYSIFESPNKDVIWKLQTLISCGIAMGVVRPLSRISFPAAEAARAFRLVAASRHRGRVLLHLHKAALPFIQPRIVCTPNYGHLILWDGSTLGLKLVDRLISRGANKLHLIKMQNKNVFYALKLRIWQENGIDVDVQEGKLNNDESILTLLKELNTVEPLEGIYVTTNIGSDQKQTELRAIIEGLDAASRKLSLKLKNFAVIGVNSDIGQKVCLSRSKDGLPATAVNFTSLKQIKGIPEPTEEWIWGRSAMEALELALLSPDPVFAAEPYTVDHTSLLQFVARITGLPYILDRKMENYTLQSLGVLDQSVTIIKSYLSDVYHVSLEKENILQLTIKRLNELEESMSEHDSTDVKGLGTFFSSVDSDELNATTDLMMMNTLVNDVRLMNYDPSKTHLYIIPGLEGHNQRFSSMCQLLKLPALVLQPGLDRPHESVQQLAQRYAEILLKKLRLKNKFYLLGYETGIFVTIELAAILEKHGLTGTVFLLGDGPDEIKAILEDELHEFENEKALQEGLLRHMTALVGGESALAEVASDTECEWSERVELCVRALRGRVSLSAQYMRALLVAAYARISSARDYIVTKHTLRSQVVLIRARVTRPEALCSLQALHIHSLPTPLHAVTADLRVPAVINRYLDREIIETFNNTNLCEQYTMNKLKKHM